MYSRLDNRYLIANIDKCEYGMAGDWILSDYFNIAMYHVAGQLEEIGDFKITEHKGTGNYKRMKRIQSDEELIDMYYHRKKEVPLYIKTMGYIRVVSKKKEDYTEHHRILGQLEMILNEYQPEWYMRRCELSMDTRDSKIGYLMKARSVPRYFQGNCRVVGDTLYQHKLTSTKSFKHYAREVNDTDIYRTEISLSRNWIRQQEYSSTMDILSNAETICRDSLMLKEPLLEKIKNDCYSGRIGKKCANEEVESIIQGHQVNTGIGLSLLLNSTTLPQREVLRRYYRSLEFPQIFTPNDYKKLEQCCTLSAYC
jgi:hypothetical protein